MPWRKRSGSASSASPMASRANGRLGIRNLAPALANHGIALTAAASSKARVSGFFQARSAIGSRRIIQPREPA